MTSRPSRDSHLFRLCLEVVLEVVEIVPKVVVVLKVVEVVLEVVEVVPKVLRSCAEGGGGYGGGCTECA